MKNTLDKSLIKLTQLYLDYFKVKDNLMFIK